MDAAKARYLAGSILDGSRTHYTSARLGTWAHCEESMEVFGDALARCPALTSVDLGDIVASRMEADALKTYRKLVEKLAVHKGKLKALDFSYNAVGPTGLKALRGLLEDQTSLESLTMVACGVSAETQESLAELLLFRTPTVLRRIVFDNNLAGEGGGKAMALVVRESPLLEEFQMSGSRIPREGGHELLEALGSMPRDGLKRLDLHDNIFGMSLGAEIAELVGKLSGLEDLCLSDLGMGDDEVATVCKSIKAPRLRVLGLGGNDLEQGGTAIGEIARLLVGLDELESVDVSDNELSCAIRVLGEAVASRVAVGKAPLKELRVACNLAHTKALADFAAAACGRGKVDKVDVGGNFAEEAPEGTFGEDMEGADEDGETEAEEEWGGQSGLEAAMHALKL